MQEITKKIMAGKAIEPCEIETAADEMMSGQATSVQIAALLTALHMRGETAEHLAAFASVLRKHAIPFRRPDGIVLDTCGTGGDNSGTFNISTTAAFIAAGAGVRVAKHGNRSVTSKCGSADVLAELNINIDAETAVMERALEEAGICFLFAQYYHSSMKHVATVRRELGFRTIFNLVGPLANPARASHQLIGVCRADLPEIHAKALALLEVKRALIVHGCDGLDEITTTGATRIAELRNGRVDIIEIAPEDFGIRRAQLHDLAGGSPAENAEIIMAILDGAGGPHTDVAIFNAGAAIHAAEMAATIGEGVEMARKAVSTGAARDKLETLRRIAPR